MNKDFYQLRDLLNRIKLKDISVWIRDQEIDNRIDWIDLDVYEVLKDIKNKTKILVDRGYDNVVLLGMGGSCLASMVFSTVYPINKKIFILDTINPDQIYQIHTAIKDQKNVFIVSSKSGTTLETNILFDYFIRNFGDQEFIFITDDGTPLDQYAKEKGFVVFNPNPNIGGRYSAFTQFGLVPAFLAGVDVDKIASDFEEIKHKTVEFVDKNFIDFYDIIKMKNKNWGYIFFNYEDNQANLILGLWLEQLIAESTGKNNKGVLPVIYKNFNLQSLLQNSNLQNSHAVTLGDFKLEKFKNDLSKWMYVWFIYTSLLGSLMEINPFNQPDVQLSKDITKKVLSMENLNIQDNYFIVNNLENLGKYIIDYLSNEKDFEYVAIHFYSSYDYFDFAEGLRNFIVNELGKISVWGFGPRYLHSIGQLYKGGADNGIFVQVIVEPKFSIDNMSKVFLGQALGDLLTMKNLNKKIRGFYVKT